MGNGDDQPRPEERKGLEAGEWGESSQQKAGEKAIARRKKEKQ